MGQVANKRKFFLPIESQLKNRSRQIINGCETSELEVFRVTIYVVSSVSHMGLNYKRKDITLQWDCLGQHQEIKDQGHRTNVRHAVPT